MRVAGKRALQKIRSPKSQQTIADDPLISVANGTGKVLQNIDYWRNAAATA